MLKKIRQKLLQDKVIVVKPNSTNISTYSYNPKTKKMVVIFSRGQIYTYNNVDINTILNLLSVQENEQSVGRAFKENVVNKFSYQKIWVS